MAVPELPDDIFFTIAATDEATYRAMLSVPRFALALTPERIAAYKAAFGHKLEHDVPLLQVIYNSLGLRPILAVITAETLYTRHGLLHNMAGPAIITRDTHTDPATGECTEYITVGRFLDGRTTDGYCMSFVIYPGRPPLLYQSENDSHCGHTRIDDILKDPAGNELELLNHVADNQLLQKPTEAGATVVIMRPGSLFDCYSYMEWGVPYNLATGPAGLVIGTHSAQ